MCDYSLEMYRTRDAVVGETLETHRFTSGSVGCVAPEDTGCAVCLNHGTIMSLAGISDHVQNTWGVADTATVTFVRTPVGPHHDAVRFDNGAVLTLQQLGPKIRIRVLNPAVDQIKEDAIKSLEAGSPARRVTPVT
jgi:hypothetical protein